MFQFLVEDDTFDIWYDPAKTFYDCNYCNDNEMGNDGVTDRITNIPFDEK